MQPFGNSIIGGLVILVLCHGGVIITNRAQYAYRESIYGSILGLAMFFLVPVGFFVAGATLLYAYNTGVAINLFVAGGAMFFFAVWQLRETGIAVLALPILVAVAVITGIIPIP